MQNLQPKKLNLLETKHSLSDDVMMALDVSIREASDGLRLARASDRKKSAEILKDFLIRNAAPALLTENTLKKRGYNWSDVFDDINDYILKETEKYETSKTFDTVTVPLCSSLLHLCVAGANKGQAYIKCERITEACLNILKDNRLAKAIGDAYLNLLYKHVLPCEHYLGYITPSTWEDLLDVAVTACLFNNSKLDDFTKLRLVLLVVNNGRNNCQYVIPLRDSLSRLKRCFLNVAYDKKVQEVVVEIVILLLDTLSTECRLTMCHFAESILSSIFKFYDQNMDQKKKSQLFKVLYGTVVLHHPRGRFQNEEGSLACDWSLWNKHLHSILEIVCLEITYLQKIRKNNDKQLKTCSHFCRLAASVYFQIFNHMKTQDNDPGSSSKRQKLCFNRNKTFSDLIDECRQNYIPWLGVIHMYMKSYGHTISIDDHITLTNVIGLLVTNSSNVNWDVFEELTCMTLKNMKANSICRNTDNAILASLWSSCVRNSTSPNTAHKALHTIMQFLLSFDALKYENALPLLKLYSDMNMPVTNGSVKTLSILLFKFFKKCSHDELRISFFTWLVHGNITSVEGNNAKELLLMVIADENISPTTGYESNVSCDTLYDTIFNSIDDSILFSEFELEHELKKNAPSSMNTCESLEINVVLEKHVQNWFTSELTEYIERLQRNDVQLLEFIKLLNAAIQFLDITVKYNNYSIQQIKEMEIYCLLKRSLTHMYVSLNGVLSSDVQISLKIKTLHSLKNILVANIEPILCTEVRLCTNNEFFHCVNNILNTKVKDDDDEVLCEEDDEEMSINSLKHHCVHVIAAYCRQVGEYRDELLDLILDPKIYNFKNDVQCALQCIEMLSDSTVEQSPLGLLFKLMANMCRDLYRDSKASLGILKMLIQMLDSIWRLDDTTKQNCLIMVKSYLQRCQQLFYPPSVAALIYQCGAKIATLCQKENRNTDGIFEDALKEKVKGEIHSIRVYCCYLLKSTYNELSEEDIKVFLTGLGDIFLIKVSEKKEWLLKDESANRTLTVLHILLALVETKKSLIRTVVSETIQFQKDRLVDKGLVKKVLNIIVKKININDIESYLDNNILPILYVWFTKNNSIVELPFYIFGCESVVEFVTKHNKWLISAEILWLKRGNLTDSDILNRATTTAAEPIATIVEKCFCNIIALCLPYIVTEKYKHAYWGSEVPSVFKQSMVHANKMFRQTGQILPSDKWTNLFVENVGDLLLLIAKHLSDHVDASQLLDVNITVHTRSYFYPKNIYLAILDYIGELTDGNIMQYLCENQPMAIFQILFQLWRKVIIETVFDFRVVALHAYITFMESIPLGYSTDAFVCNFACNNFGHAIKHCNTHEDIKLFVCGLRVILEKWLPNKVDLIRKPVSLLLPILLIKMEQGYEKECVNLLNYLVVDMKHHLKEDEDVVVFISSMSQGAVNNDNTLCASMISFQEKLKTYKLNLVSPSSETLLKLRMFLKSNKHYLKALQSHLDIKGFSEDCQTSLIHQVIWSLNNILQSASDSKTIIEACNCLSEIGTYDLKTLVTVPPADTQKVVGINPKHYFAATAVKALTDVLFDEDATVTSKVADTLNSLLKHFEDNDNLGLEDLQIKILKPLSSVNNTIAHKIVVDIKAFDEYCAECEEGIFINSLITNWSSNSSENHCEWLKLVTRTLLSLIERSCSYIESLQQVCSSKSNVCNKILPSLIGLIIYHSSENYVKIIGEQMNKFFTYIWDQTFDDKVENSGDSHVGPKVTDRLDHGQKMVVQYMLDIVDFVRLQRNYYKTRSNRTVETLNYLRLEYDKVAWAATVADQNLAALFYGELWAVAQNNGVPPASPEFTTNLNGGLNVQQIFRKCYVSIGEMDAVDGCGTAHLTIESEKRRHLINTGQYTDALLLHDIALSCGPCSDHDLQCGVVRSLHKSGMHHLALQYIKSLPENDELNDIKYDCLSFLGDWSDFADTRELEEKSKEATCNPNSILKAFHYACLKDCLTIQTTHDFENKMVVPLNRAKLAVSRLCQDLNMENCQGVYKVVSKLHLITDIEDYFSVRTGMLPITELLNRWQTENLPSYNDFKHLEAMISQRVLILEHAAKLYNGLLKDILSLQIKYAKLGLTNNTVQMAQRVLAVAKKLQSSPEISLVDSEISWAKGHKEIALSLLRNIVTNETSDDTMSGMSLRQYGLWMAESKRDNARDIINKYLLKSLTVLRRSDHTETRLKVYHDIAKFADAEYKQVVAYMNSSIFENKVKCLESMKGTSSSLRSTQQALTRDERKVLHVNDRFKELDEAEIASTRAEKKSFLHLAMRYYLLSLKQCEENNLSVFRVISLWVENPSFEFEDTEHIKFSDRLCAIPSRKFITVLPQLAPRLTNDSCDFADNLRKIIKRCAIEHPHHTLPILFSLKNSDKDKVIMNASAGSGAGCATPLVRAPEPRVLAAEALVKQISEQDEQLAVIVAQMEKICDATISFANYKPATKVAKQKIPTAEKIHKLKNLDAVPVPTVVIPVRSDCKYIYLPTIQSFENYFELVGGINCPKKISCTDSSGNRRVLLVKGEDDLRQDAVMQQVFNIVNTLLEKNPVTSRKKLLIRTYKVVPMSRQSGVLEWCIGTMPIGFYLTGAGTPGTGTLGTTNTGAHARYRPQDISYVVAHKKMIECHEARKNNKDKLLVFTRILSEFKPVFHYFFTEHYLNPVTWYERRLAYTNSVATSSMVGYILGLGDRHVQNILIDKMTAEVIHIDFGIAFDQGKTLHTPETVPFRLTQDIIAGFGSSGVEGIFRRCCEKTMQLLRDNRETLLTILEVLLCDPLYSWTVSTAQQNNTGNRDININGVGGSNSGLAERALLTVSSKLSGTEGGVAGGVAVPGQVARLLQTAADPANLCRLFPGWRPYL